MSGERWLWVLPSRGTTWHARYESSPRTFCGRIVNKVREVGTPPGDWAKCTNCRRDSRTSTEQSSNRRA